ncbi:MAG: YceI family protein [Lysobacterales bacterium]
MPRLSDLALGRLPSFTRMPELVATLSRFAAVSLAGLCLQSSLQSAEPAPTEPEEAEAQRYLLDPTNTHVGFDIVALWILRRRGEFRDIEGAMTVAPDRGSAVIEVRIRVASVEMPNPEHTELLLSPEFFDASEHPWIEFRSDRFVPGEGQWLDLPGTLQVRGISQRVQFSAQTSRCSLEPGQRCEVEVDGSLSRSQFGMTEYRRTLADEVHLRIFATMLSHSEQAAAAVAATPDPADD